MLVFVSSVVTVEAVSVVPPAPAPTPAAEVEAEAGGREGDGTALLDEEAAEAGCTKTGTQPPGAWVIFASSLPTRRGMEGPVRSTSRIPTDRPWRVRAKASCRVTDDLPTPPLPDRTCGFFMKVC